ncbi:MAG: SDR family oxidoreductase [Dongiaceae bacterium]
MSKRLDGRIAIVAGGTKGLGAAISRRIAGEGAHVLIAGRDNEAGNELARSIAQEGGSAKFQHADMAEPDSGPSLVATALREWGRVDILAYNAGIFPQSMLTDMTIAEWDRTMAVNLRGAMLAVQACIPEMTRNRYGRIVLTSSITGPRVAVAGWTHYAASKGGLNGFMRAAAVELGPLGITINAIEPGNIWNSSGPDTFSPARAAIVPAVIPLGHIGEPDDIGWAAVYLASDEAKYVTGQSLIVDGGQILPEWPLDAPA